jgi:hypothetical protein
VPDRLTWDLNFDVVGLIMLLFYLTTTAIATRKGLSHGIDFSYDFMCNAVTVLAYYSIGA